MCGFASAALRLPRQLGRVRGLCLRWAMLHRAADEKDAVRARGACWVRWQREAVTFYCAHRDQATQALSIGRPPSPICIPVCLVPACPPTVQERHRISCCPGWYSSPLSSFFPPEKNRALRLD